MAMPARSYSEIRDWIGRELADLSAPAAREAVIEHLTELTFELNRLKQQQQALLAGLRTRDIVLRDTNAISFVGAGGPVEIDARDALDMTDGFYDIEWDKEVAYRWTGPGHDTLVRVWLDRALPLVCEIDLLSYGDERNRGAIALTVDGAVVATAQTHDKLLRSQPFSVLGGSFYTEVGIHVPWLSGGGAPGDHANATGPTPDAASADGRPMGRPAGGRRSRRSPDRPVDVRLRGIAITQLRFLSST